MEKYSVRPLKADKNITVTVPGSKSITNRALLLAALGKGPCLLKGVLFSEDSRAFLGCLKALSFNLDINEDKKTVLIGGTGGEIPNKKATLYVGSAGTAARFLTVFLAFAGGEYEMTSSPQMEKRPMEPLLSSLREAGVKIECLKEEGHFPFIIKSEGVNVKAMETDTTVSSQFASAMLMSAPLLKGGLNVKLTGSRTDGAYIKITLKMMEQFGIKYVKNDTTVTIPHAEFTNIKEYEIEPDVSGAAYFYAMSPICSKNVCVRGVHLTSMQGDIKFLKALETLGCRIKETDEGILMLPPEPSASGAATDSASAGADTSPVSYPGISINMNDFSDQALTMAVVLAFASSESTISGIGHIKAQECDRMAAIVNNLKAIGCECEMTDEESIRIIPASLSGRKMHGSEIETYEDHRVAMSFALAGLRVPGIIIKNPLCCRKTFENYFEVLDSLCDF